MACLPNPGKCEWAEIKHFVAHYNEMRSSDFQHECCLDLKSSQKEPEVICRNTIGQTIVVERKSLIWPLDYVQMHKAEHFLWDSLIKNLKGACGDAPYLLGLAPPSTTNKQTLSAVAAQLADAIKREIPHLVLNEAVEFSTPIPWAIRKQPANERDGGEPERGLAITSSVSPYQELVDPKCVPDAFIAKITEYFSACDKKFARYESSTRVLLLNFVSLELLDKCNALWWRTFLNVHVPPNSINEIWSTYNYVADSWGFEQLY